MKVIIVFLKIYAFMYTRVYQESVNPSTKKLHIENMGDSDAGQFDCEAVFPLKQFRTFFNLQIHARMSEY